MPVRSPNSLIDYLPAIYQEDPFVGQFLLAFQKVLLGVDDTVPILDVKFQPLEQAIATIATLFDPKSTPKEFLNWLAGLL